MNDSSVTCFLSYQEASINNNNTFPPGKSNRYYYRESQQDKYEIEDEEFFVIGDRVFVDGYKTATVAYFGEVDFAGGDFVGVVFDEPTFGNHNGRVHGRHYFECPPGHGLFVRPNRVTRISDSALGSSAASSRTSTPMPSFLHHRWPSSSHGAVSRSPGSSLSYYYDEDYRQDKQPTVSSLTQKLKSINDSTSSGFNTSTSSRHSNIDTPTRSGGAGILKHNSRSQSTDPMSSSARIEELSDRARAQSVSRSPVFNFRPRREPINNYNHGQSKSIDRDLSQSGKTLDLSTEPADIGDRVIVSSEKGNMMATLRFLGETEFATGEWAGVELDYPDGKNNGEICGVKYFDCPDRYGLFLPAIRIRKYKPSSRSELESSRPVFNSMRYTLKSPPPSSRSTTPSYDRSSSAASSYRTSSPAWGLSSSTSYNTKSRMFDDTPRQYSGGEFNSTSLSYIDETPYRDYSFVREKPKFDEKDIDIQLKKDLKKSLSKPDSNYKLSKPKAVEYTFSSSKFDDAQPVTWRKLIFD